MYFFSSVPITCCHLEQPRGLCRILEDHRALVDKSTSCDGPSSRRRRRAQMFPPKRFRHRRWAPAQSALAARAAAQTRLRQRPWLRTEKPTNRELGIDSQRSASLVSCYGSYQSNDEVFAMGTRSIPIARRLRAQWFSSPQAPSLRIWPPSWLRLSRLLESRMDCPRTARR